MDDELKTIAIPAKCGPDETTLAQTDEALESEVARFVSEGGGLGPVPDFAH